MDSNYRRGPLAADEPVILLDRKDREYLSRLDQRRPIAIRGGKIAVEDIIGHDEGIVVRSSVNEPFLVFRPSLPQLIPNLPRTAQVIYPKDIGPILIWADLFPGARVIEAGVGAGALSMALLRAIGADGQAALLRPGAIPRDEIEPITGALAAPARGAVSAPGMLESHFGIRGMDAPGVLVRLASRRLGKHLPQRPFSHLLRTLRHDRS